MSKLSVLVRAAIDCACPMFAHEFLMVCIYVCCCSFSISWLEAHHLICFLLTLKVVAPAQAMPTVTQAIHDWLAPQWQNLCNVLQVPSWVLRLWEEWVQTKVLQWSWQQVCVWRMPAASVHIFPSCWWWWRSWNKRNNQILMLSVLLHAVPWPNVTFDVICFVSFCSVQRVPFELRRPLDLAQQYLHRTMVRPVKWCCIAAVPSWFSLDSWIILAIHRIFLCGFLTWASFAMTSQHSVLFSGTWYQYWHHLKAETWHVSQLFLTSELLAWWVYTDG